MVTSLARVPTPRVSKPSDETAEALHLPRPYKVRNYYTPKEVSEHNCADNCWVSLFNQVFDLTRLIEKNHDKTECDPIVLASGTDITHWFDPETKAVSNSKALTLCTA
jgi:cytochrome b involved in lipid metabolism